MKCKMCKAKMPAAVLERVCPKCGWRTPSIRMLLIQAIAITTLCIYLILMRYFGEGEPYFLYLTFILGVTAIFGWSNYVIVMKRRKGLGYDG
jgi:hypothetical protein